MRQAALETLTEKVDFRKQLILALTWKGSGRDRLIIPNAATDAEQFIFEILPGKTMDLKPDVEEFYFGEAAGRASRCFA